MDLFNRIISGLRNIPVALNGIAISLITLYLFYKITGYFFLSLLLFILACFIIAIKTLKYTLHRDVLKAELDNYIQGGYLPLFSMFIAGLAHAVYPLSHLAGLYLWYSAFVIHSILLAYLYYSHYRQNTFSLILPSWFIPPIGFIAVGLGAVDVTTNIIGHFIYAFSAIVFIPMSIAIIYRQIVRPLNKQEIPTSGIYAAPVSLLILAYLDYYPNNSYPILLMILFLINLIYLSFSFIGLYISFFKQSYSHGIASFTFPFAVAGVSLLKCQHIYPVSIYISWLTIITATIVTAYVLYKQFDHRRTI